MNCNCPRSSYGIKHTPECYDTLVAENSRRENALSKIRFAGNNADATAVWMQKVAAHAMEPETWPDPDEDDDGPDETTYMASLKLTPNVCPTCGSDDLHSASLGGEDAISCGNCEWIATIASFAVRLWDHARLWDHDHQWVDMRWQEAYPASSGIRCSVPGCDEIRLGWLGAQPDMTVRSDAPEFGDDTG